MEWRSFFFQLEVTSGFPVRVSSGFQEGLKVSFSLGWHDVRVWLTQASTCVCRDFNGRQRWSSAYPTEMTSSLYIDGISGFKTHFQIVVTLDEGMSSGFQIGVRQLPGG
jgi:hypothetical protein